MPERDTRLIRRHAAISAAMKRLPFVRNRQIRENLDAMQADLVEAYRIGAEEAQREIVSRLIAITFEGEAEP